MPKVLKEKILVVKNLNKDLFRFTIKSPYVAKNAKAGQFVNIKCCDGINALLRRPISICRVDRENETFDVVFQIKGNGTDILSKKESNDDIDVIAPLGNGFNLSDEYKNILVIGGGIGVFPLLGLLEESPAIDKTTILSFRSKDYVVLEEEFKKVGNDLFITTDDGSYANKGFVTDFAKKVIEEKQIDMIYACGPTPMLKAVKALAEENKVPCQVSMEERMGCGIGACLVCACKTKLGDEWEYSHVCSDGPVFDAEEVVFE